MGEIDNDISALQFPCSLKELVNMTKIEFKTKELEVFCKMGWEFYNEKGQRAIRKLNFYKEIEALLAPDFLTNSPDKIGEHPVIHKYSNLLDTTVEPQPNPQPNPQPVDPPIEANSVASNSMDIGNPQMNSTRI